MEPNPVMFNCLHDFQQYTKPQITPNSCPTHNRDILIIFDKLVNTNYY